MRDFGVLSGVLRDLRARGIPNSLCPLENPTGCDDLNMEVKKGIEVSDCIM